MKNSTFYSLLLVFVIAVYFGGHIFYAIGDDSKIEKIEK